MKKQILELEELRKKFSAMKQEIAETEQKILSAYPNLKLEGTTKTEFGSIVTELTRKLDIKAYELCRNSLPKDLRFVLKSPKIDLKKLKEAERFYPEITSTCITTKPAKTVIKIKEAKE